MAQRAGLVLGALALVFTALLHVRVERLSGWARPHRQASPRPQVAAPGVHPSSGAAPALRTFEDDDIDDITVITYPPVDSAEIVPVLDGFNALNSPTGRLALFAATGAAALESRLKLTPGQKERVEEIVQWTNRRLDNLLSLPGPGGKSPCVAVVERKKMARQLVAAGKGKVSVHVEPVNCREWKVPGCDYTFGEECNRIAVEGYDRIRALLDEDQRRRYANAPLDLFSSDRRLDEMCGEE